MPKKAQADFEISIFVPGGDIAEQHSADPAVENHSLREFIPSFGRIEKISAAEVQEQWSRTIDTLMTLSSNIADRSDAWSIDEIEVGLTLSAQGQLLFIAEAGAEASIKFTMKRRPPVAPAGQSKAAAKAAR